MKSITAKDNQTLFDIALLAYGRAEAAYDIAEENDLPVSATLDAGTVLRLPLVLRTDPAVSAYYELQGIAPSTGLTADQQQDLDPEGISYWFIKSPLPAFTVTPRNS